MKHRFGPDCVLSKNTLLFGHQNFPGPKICHTHRHSTIDALDAQFYIQTYNMYKVCVAVLTMLYKKNDAVSCVGSGFFSDWALYLDRTWLVVTRFARNKKWCLS